MLSPNNDRDFDQFTKGMIRAYNEVLELDIEPTVGEEEANEV